MKRIKANSNPQSILRRRKPGIVDKSCSMKVIMTEQESFSEQERFVHADRNITLYSEKEWRLWSHLGPCGGSGGQAGRLAGRQKSR